MKETNIDKNVSLQYNNSARLNALPHLENGIACNNSFAEPLVLTAKETAKLLQISLPTAYQLIRQKSFPSLRIGKKIFVNKLALQKWLDDNTKWSE